MNLKKAWYNLTHWEKWHYHAKYIPLYPAWLWYCLRSGSLWFFTPSNPTITFGGFEGEGKKEIYEQLPPTSYPKSIYILPQLGFDEVCNLVAQNGFKYPFAVKPEKGMMGFLFRKIDRERDLKAYHQKMPVEYIIQELVTYPLEVSVFYYRHPAAASGTITGFLKKEAVEVTGDGNATLEKLIECEAHRPGFKVDEWKTKHAANLHQIIPEGEVFRVSLVANLSRGGRLISLAHEKDEKLLKVFDDLSHYAKHFYYGRYDIKCASIEDLKEGKNFSILEYNGSGAEPHHIYGNGNNVWQAYRIILQHWQALYNISAYNNRHGYKYWPFLQGWGYLKKAKKHFAALKKLDKGELV